jgi:alkylhydroperoxidase/carboxymuconolactone decarboxylase family protein YurZ
MTETYYECRDLEDFANIGEHAPEAGSKFFEYYAAATGAGKLTEREKALIALTAATVRHCPYQVAATAQPLWLRLFPHADK